MRFAGTADAPFKYLSPILEIQGNHMTSFNFATSPQVQFPLRLSYDLTSRFNQISKSTRIPKSTLGRIAIKSLLDEIDEKGITSVLEGVRS